MGGNTHFKVPYKNSDDADFKPMTSLPEDLRHFADAATKMRAAMNVEMQKMLELTDMMALRSAAMPQHE